MGYIENKNDDPGPVSNDNLIRRNRLKSGLSKNKDFWCINEYCWLFLIKKYGGGPEIKKYKNSFKIIECESEESEEEKSEESEESQQSRNEEES